MNIIEIEKEVKDILKELPSESVELDYKQRFYKVEKKCDFVKDVIAILNSFESIWKNKYIIFGVSDKKELVGVDNEQIINDSTFQDWVKNYIFPEPIIKTGTVEFENKKFGYICISKNNKYCIYEANENVIGDFQIKSLTKNAVLKGQAFFRRGSKNEVMTQEDREKILLNENSVFYQQHILKLENRIKEFENRIPNLKLGLKLLGNINDNEENKSEWNEYNFSKNIKIKGKNVQPYDYIFKKAHNYNEFLEEFKKYVTNEYIDNYNMVIIEKSDEIDKYNRDCLLYSSIFENGQIFNLFVENEGIAKALDIKIIIEFPKDILVKFTDEAKNTPEPIKPDIPKSPLNKINEERDKELYESLGFNKIDRPIKNINNIYNRLMEYNSVNGRIDNSVISKSILDSVNDSPKNFTVNIKEHKIDIKVKELLYMDSEQIDNICIIPTKTGIFDVKVSIICEEYPKPQEYTITFEVEDK